MDTDSILLETRGAVAELTLNRPTKLNCFDSAMRSRFLDALRHCDRTRSIRAILLTGAGKGFCAGQDLAELIAAENAGRPLSFDSLMEEYNVIVTLLTGTEKPIVCAVNGAAAGAGANLALACDFVFAASEASFMQAFVHVGLVPDTGGSYFLPRLVGLAKAKELSMLGGKLTAEEAERLGLIYRRTTGDELLPEARLCAEHLAQLPTQALGRTKRLLNASLGKTLSEQLALEKELQVASSHTNDYREGVHAFVEKRTPKFQGK